MLANKQLGLNHEVRQLGIEDFAAWKELRLEALALYPEAFSATYEEESKLSVDDFKASLKHSDIFGVLYDGKLVGMAGVTGLQLKKFAHRGNLFGMYLKKEYRGLGMADDLMQVIIEHARHTLVQLTCGVILRSDNAVRFYQRHGFKVVGTVPRSLKLDGVYYDEHWMYLKLD